MEGMGEQRNFEKDARIIESPGPFGGEHVARRAATHGQRKGARRALVAPVAGGFFVGRVGDESVNCGVRHRQLVLSTHVPAPRSEAAGRVARFARGSPG